MRQRRCPKCRHWYELRGYFGGSDCPACGAQGPRFNKWLRTANLNSALYRQAEDALRH